MRQNRAKKAVCCQCQREIENEIIKEDSQHRSYCIHCKPIEEIKNSWRPLGSGSVSGIFIIRSDR